MLFLLDDVYYSYFNPSKNISNTSRRWPAWWPMSLQSMASKETYIFQKYLSLHGHLGDVALWHDVIHDLLRRGAVSLS